MPINNGDLAAMSATHWRRASSNSASGTTLLTNPAAAASAALISRPVIISSLAPSRPVARKISAEIMNGKAPTLISGQPNRIDALAMTRSQARAMPSAPASTSPFAAQTTGLSIPVSVRYRVGNRDRPAYLVIVGRLSANASRLPPEEKTPGGGDGN